MRDQPPTAIVNCLVENQPNLDACGISHGPSPYTNSNQRTNATLADNTKWAYGYDILGQVTSGKHYSSGGTAVAGQQYEYGFDDIGNRTLTKAGGDQNGANLRTATYTANVLNQYTSRTVPGAVDVLGMANTNATVTVNGNTTIRQGEYFDYALTITNSSAPNWQSVTVAASNGGNTNTVTGNVFLPQTPESFTFDSDGNLTQDGRWDNTWDLTHEMVGVAVRRGPDRIQFGFWQERDTPRISRVKENRLVSAVANTAVGPQQRIEFEYDCQSRRIAKKVWNNTAGTGSPATTLKFIWDGWNYIAAVDGNNTVVQSYLWGLDLSGSLQGAGGVGGMIAVRPSGAPSHFAIFDGNGNVAGLVDGSTGTLSARYEYGPFGEQIAMTGPMAIANPCRWEGKYTDAETGLIYYGLRYYDLNLGRWLARDPIQEQGGANLYACVRNDPINFIDPLGQKCCGGFVLSEINDIPVPVMQQPAAGGNTKLNGYKVLYLPCDGCQCPPDKIKLVQAKKWKGFFTGETPSFDGGSGSRNALGQIVYPAYGGYEGPEGSSSLLDAPYNSRKPTSRFQAEVCAVCSKASGDKVLGCVSFEFDGADRLLTPPSDAVKLGRKDSAKYGETGNLGTPSGVAYIAECKSPAALFNAAAARIPSGNK